MCSSQGGGDGAVPSYRRTRLGMPALSENWSSMASGDVSKRCRKTIDLNRSTVLCVGLYLKRATLIYAQLKSCLDEHGIEVEGV